MIQKFAWMMITAALCYPAELLHAVRLDLGVFQTADGAITLNPGGNYVEPYFATKALIVAQDGGLDVHQAASAWIGWALPRQQASGLFRRFCREQGEWRDCAAADADDSMLALWVQLLYRMAPASGIPHEWQRSIDVSTHQLDKLRNRRLGLYHISQRNHVALFMDNVEVYAALKDVANAKAHLRAPDAGAVSANATHLQSAIVHVFWNSRHQQFRPSMQKTRFAFYPDAVAQVYPWLAGISGPGQDPNQAWKSWKNTYGPGWLARRYDTHPWGLVALAANQLGDSATAVCWTSQSDPLRGSNSWNVLEEAVWQSLHASFTQMQLLEPHACAGILVQ